MMAHVLQRIGRLTALGGIVIAMGCGLARADDSDEGFVDHSGRWQLSVYSGKAAKDRLLDIITRYNTGFIDSYLVAVAPGYIHRETRRWRFEIEGQAVKHWGLQDHWEFNAAYIARWKPFPWDEFVDTSLAAGAGVSYALEVPPIEPRADRVTAERSAKLLGYLMAEVAFAPPGDARWAVFVRLHHRSGAKGLFKDVDGGSNFITGGLRWRF
ncbi:MAG: hypothetical protein Kow0020_13960 [Wenzhouxiangellaceae bacterium]